MSRQRSCRGFTWIELVAILVVSGFLLALLVPAIQSARESSRRKTCTNNMKLIGLGLYNYHDARIRFPGSAELISQGDSQTVGGWSFLFKILPNMDYAKEYDSIPNNILKDSSIDPLTHADPALVKLRNTHFSEFTCPSNPNKIFENPAKELIAFTNYKAMGATSIESLRLCTDFEAPVPYGDRKIHPDGGLFPTNNKGIRINDLADGTSHTVLVVETMDDTKSSWLAGADATLVGMPKAEYAKYNGSFWAPAGFNGNYYGYAAPEIQALRTYLSFDFRPGQKDAGAYPASVGRTPAYGPSSSHPGITNHLFADGGVRGIRNDVDYAGYFFSITKANGDPALSSGGDF
jgi:type II secretory pathway pseudopilin PulG